MRVGLLTYSLDRARGGIARYTIELARALTALPNSPATLTLLAAGGLGPLEDTVLAVHRLPGSAQLPWLLTRGQAQLAQAARTLGLDVVHDPVGIFPLALVRGAARVVTLHDVFPLSAPGHSTAADTLIYRHWLPRAVRHADAVMTDSWASAQDILTHLPVQTGSLTVNPIGVDVQRFHTRSTHQQREAVRARYGLPERMVLYVGSVEQRKNLVGVLRAFAQIAADVPHTLVVVGAKQWRYSAIETEHDALGLGDRVLFTGFVDDNDLPLVYQNADVFVFPSFYEGFGLPVLEAMACNVPVVTSNVSSLPEVAGDAALLVDPHDTAAIAAALRRVLTEPGLADVLRTRGLAQAAQFSWEDAAQRTLDVYAQVHTLWTGRARSLANQLNKPEVRV